MNLLQEVCLLLSLIGLSSAVPLIGHPYCPVINGSDLEPGLALGSKVIRMNEIEGQKVRLQFYYPGASSSKRSSGEDSTTFLSPSMQDVDQGGVTSTGGNLQQDEVTTSSSSSGGLDVSCQWDFRAGNDSQFLLLTFEKLSAPYSENCAEAYVAMQKDNGYESRWCGNRRQANSRPMALFSRGSAKVSVYRSGDAPSFPSTGFTVVVQSVDANMIEGGKSSLRVLLG